LQILVCAYYANFASTTGEKKIEGIKRKANVMNFGVNVDALYNFIADDSLSFGAFLGLGLGLNSWSGSLITGLKDDMAGLGAKVTTSGFGAALNVGLRTEIAKAHGIELAARVPFVATTLVNKDGLKVTATHNYNVGLRYIFSF
uniref:outer membrane beta-barrel protein n=2 Tax=Helicobacteraceae TaxID=72293 RepID=UPI002FE17EE1